MRILLLILAAVTLAIGGYVYWWHQVADLAVQQATYWKNERIREGYKISNSPIDVSGFPYRIKLSVQDLSITAPVLEQQKRGRMAVLKNLWIVTQPWKINHVIYGLNDAAKVHWYDGETEKSVTFDANSAQGSATFNRNGKMETLAIDIKALVINTSWRPPVRADRLQMHRRPYTPPTDQQTKTALPAQQYAIRLDTLTLGDNPDFPLGSTIEHFGVSTVLEGDPKDFQNKAAIAQWRDKGGIVDVQEMTLLWGTSTLKANGTLSLDKNNRPIGAFTAKITGFNPILGALVQAKKLDKNVAQTATFALNMLAKENEKGERYLDIPLTLQEGGLFLGPLFLMQIDPLFK